ncbi:hypothetical protein CEXT_597191 [Caerostris extrusa]|uniref:Uncharacterized protein n=1 Tax=Caerostris extrusa TaxID=172846 RepID=A0AAV4RXQ9_CAEEX|nr:hypothetical protein CEXT_597191 [Caerostris extrusa]
MTTDNGIQTFCLQKEKLPDNILQIMLRRSKKLLDSFRNLNVSENYVKPYSSTCSLLMRLLRKVSEINERISKKNSIQSFINIKGIIRNLDRDKSFAELSSIDLCLQ